MRPNNLKLVLLFLLVLPISGFSQLSPIPDSSKVILDKGYPITLLLSDTISSSFSQVGDNIKFKLKEDVVINGKICIPKESSGFGTVTEAMPRRGLGKKGILSFSINTIVLSSGKVINVSSDQKAAGKSKTGAMVATAAIISPLFLLKKGKDITFYPGKEFIAYTLEEYSF